MASSAGKQITTIYILPNISRSKENQTMKFTQLVEHNREIFFLKNYTPKMEEKLVPHLYLKSKIRYISVSTV